MLRAKYNLNGHPSLKGATKVRVFCPEHKRGFFAPRQSPIKCENRGHLLGEIDFEGQAVAPVKLQWQYCCNCEHFCPIDFDQYGLQRCPVCTRRSSLIYVCDHCYVVSFESNTPLQTKNFTLTADGVPQPSCPGCLRPAAADLFEHTCDETDVSFVTGLNSCPICSERLDIAPSFPSLVAQYLKRTKSANKVHVTFDYESGVFVPVEDGEFVIVTNMERPAVLPRAPKFSSRRDFYEFYQDYYHCANPDAGDVQIIQPAIVRRESTGWSLIATGLLEVIETKSIKKSTPAVKPPPPAPPPTRHEEPPPPPVATRREETGVKACAECGSLIEDRYSFCWKCGHSLESSRQPGQTLSSTPADVDDELTVQHEPSPFRSAALPWTTNKAADHPSSSRGSVLKLLAIALVSVLLLSLGVFGLFRSETTTVTAMAPAPVEQPASQPQPSAETTTELSRSAPEETTTQQAASTPETELIKLREQSVTAKASERSKIFRSFSKIEKKYPRDYRFPYERAKLAVKTSRGRSHRAAFKALNVAAEKAINTGKAGEMLNGLESDKVGDFSTLSHGHEEWSRLVAALRRKDASLLSE